MSRSSKNAVGILTGTTKVTALALAVAFTMPSVASAQNYSSPGSSWSSSWGFSSASDRTLALQRANLVRDAKTEDEPQTVIYQETYQDIYNDNRANYIENITDEGSVTASLGDMVEHLGDEIGTNTNSIGSMNTGEISVQGDDNDITATNQALNDGCVDASVNTSLLDASTSVDALPGLSSGLGARSTSCD